MSHLRGILPGGWRASLLAMDGAVCDDVPRQTRQLPRDATHIALSVGGNDVLRHIDLLDSPAESTAHALDLFGRRVDGFETAYERALDTVVLHRLPVIVCTIYNGALRNADDARRARLALTMFNDVIARAAWQRGCDLLDLRLVCSDAADYANPIEPSGRGGAKIARALARGAGALPEREPCLYTPHCTPV